MDKISFEIQFTIDFNYTIVLVLLFTGWGLVFSAQYDHFQSKSLYLYFIGKHLFMIKQLEKYVFVFKSSINLIFLVNSLQAEM